MNCRRRRQRSRLYDGDGLRLGVLQLTFTISLLASLFLPMSRRLPVYLLIDTSGSMKGTPIQSVSVGMEALLAGLRQNPHTLEMVHLSVITFDLKAQVLCPLTSLEEFQNPQLTCPDSGPTHTGEALKTLCQRVDMEIIRSTPERKGDWRPLLFLMTDGKPSDGLLYEEMAALTRKKSFAQIVACAAGEKADPEPLRKLADHVVTLDTMDSASFSAFFKLVSDSVASGALSMGVTSELPLPPPPPEVHVAVV